MCAVYRGERSEIMLGGGLHMIDFDIAIDGARLGGDPNESGQHGASDLLAPLPNLRLQGFHALTDKWSLGLTIGWLSANYEDYEGSFGHANLRTSYRFTPGFAASIGYHYTAIDLTHDESDGGELELDITFKGPALKLAYSF